MVEHAIDAGFGRRIFEKNLMIESQTSTAPRFAVHNPPQ